MDCLMGFSAGAGLIVDEAIPSAKESLVQCGHGTPSVIFLTSTAKRERGDACGRSADGETLRNGSYSLVKVPGRKDRGPLRDS